jgi:hypothetical protein
VLMPTSSCGRPKDQLDETSKRFWRFECFFAPAACGNVLRPDIRSRLRI